MLKSRVIPCLLISNGGLVKTTKFSDPKYVGDPINAVRIFNEKKVDELILLDISSGETGYEIDFELLRTIAAQARMPLCYGGGVRNISDAMKLVSIGFEKVSFSSAAIERPQLLKEAISAIGSQSVILTIDIKKRRFSNQYYIYTRNGNLRADISLQDFVEKAEEYGVGELVVNCIDRDGTMTGYDLELAKMVRSWFSPPLTILGGARNVTDLCALESSIGISGAAAGSMFVFNGKYRAVLISYCKP
jgi:imidazole glycerol-phosphate synthase subunit HisF